MKSASDGIPSDFRAPLAGLLGWLVPGLGHLFIGERVRGVIFLATISITFWTGMAIGGVRNTVNPGERQLWFMGQICAGGHALAALAWSRQIEPATGRDHSSLIAYGREEEVSVVYTAICGLLNILIIFDVLVRAEQQQLAASRRGLPPGRARSSR